MPSTVRLPDRVEEALAQYCAKTKQTKSEVIIQALEQRLMSAQTSSSAFLSASQVDFVGCVDDLPADLASNSKALLKEKIRAKHSR